jgi:iron complex outermembrane receptor protein
MHLAHFALALGSQHLIPEESTSFTIGAVFHPFDNTSVTIDFYDITIEDRLTLFAIEGLTQDDVDDLTDAGIPFADIFLGASEQPRWMGRFRWPGSRARRIGSR